MDAKLLVLICNFKIGDCNPFFVSMVLEIPKR